MLVRNLSHKHYSHCPSIMQSHCGSGQRGSSFSASSTNLEEAQDGILKPQFSQPAASLASGQRWNVTKVCLGWWFTPGWGSPWKLIFGDFKSVDENGNKGGDLDQMLRYAGRKWWQNSPHPISKKMALGSWVSTLLFLSPPYKSTLNHLRNWTSCFLLAITGNSNCKPIRIHPELPVKSFTDFTLLVS